MVEHLHHRADADGEQEGDDEGRHRAAQRGLGRQQAPIGRLAIDCASPLIESACADALATSARAMPRPRLDDPLKLRARDGVPHRLESVAIRIDGDSLVEKVRVNIFS